MGNKTELCFIEDYNRLNKTRKHDTRNLGYLLENLQRKYGYKVSFQQAVEKENTTRKLKKSRAQYNETKKKLVAETTDKVMKYTYVDTEYRSLELATIKEKEKTKEQKLEQEIVDKRLYLE